MERNIKTKSFAFSQLGYHSLILKKINLATIVEKNTKTNSFQGNDVYAEPEAEPSSKAEPEPEPGTASTLTPLIPALIFALAALNL